MKQLAPFILAAFIAGATCLSGHYVVTRHTYVVPLWFARYVLPVQDYYVLKASREVDSLEEAQRQMWDLYEDVRFNSEATTREQLLKLDGIIAAIETLPDAHLELMLRMAFVAAEINSGDYEALFRETVKQAISTNDAHIAAQADLLAFFHNRSFVPPPNTELFDELRDFSIKYPHSIWGVELFTSTATQLRIHGHYEAALRTLTLGSQCYPHRPTSRVKTERKTGNASARSSGS